MTAENLPTQKNYCTFPKEVNCTDYMFHKKKGSRMENEALLVILANTQITQTETIFQQYKQSAMINAPGDLMRELVTLCNGTLSKVQIINSLSLEWDLECVEELLDQLLHSKVVVDSRYICEDMWQYATNPSRFAHKINEYDVNILAENAWNRHKNSSVSNHYPKSTFSFGNLLEDRHSTYHFSELPVDMQIIVDMLWSGYGECRGGKRTVPSAGALYPIMLDIVLMQPSGKLSPGMYRVCVSQIWSIGFKLISTDIAKFQRAFIDPLMVEKACGAIVISGSLQITAEKYANRSMLFVPLEAGHVAQNIHLAAYSHNLATVEIGGFVEHALQSAVNAPNGYLPMTTILFGHASKVTNSAADMPEFHWVMPTKKSYQTPFAVAQARVSPNLNDDWSCGRDTSPTMALTKAIAEAKEWAACGCIPHHLLKERIKDMPNVIDPREIISFHESQYGLPDFPLEPFDETAIYEWVEGKDEISGERKQLLADLVYFPYSGYTKEPYLFANSSGVAAHPNLQKAIESGALELVERDSFMIAYLTGLNFPSILTESLPQYLRKRISMLEKEGFTVIIKDHTLELTPVVTVFVQNKRLTYTNCASCSRFDFESAIDHALMEVESSVFIRLQNGPAQKLEPTQVSMPLQHGALYEQKAYFCKANFMFEGGNVALKECANLVNSWDKLLHKLHQTNLSLITTNLFLSEQYGGNGELHIVRSFIPGLVPMTFGYRQEPGGMSRLYNIAKQKGKRLTYGNIRKFPHPFA